MIDYKYPTIASGDTPIGSAGRAPDKKIISRRTRKKISSPWTQHLLPLGEQISRSRRSKKLKLEEIKVWRSQRNRSLKKSKFEEVEVWRSRRYMKSKTEEIKVWRIRRLKKSKFEEVKVLETQPESATRIESRGLLTWICPSGTHGLVYRVWPIKEVENYKDSKMTWRRRRKVPIRIWLGLL
jgi:hypothetical protein